MYIYLIRSIRIRRFFSKLLFCLAVVGMSLSITFCTLFLFCHWARNYRSGNMLYARLFFFTGLFFWSFIKHHGRYLTKGQLRIVWFLIWASGLWSVVTKIYMSILIIINASYTHLYIEYSGDWYIWIYLICIAFIIIFFSPDYKENYKKLNDDRKSKKGKKNDK